MGKRKTELTKPNSPKVLPSKIGVDYKCPPNCSINNKGNVRSCGRESTSKY